MKYVPGKGIKDNMTGLPKLGADDSLDLFQRGQIAVFLQHLLVPARRLQFSQFLRVEPHFVQSTTGAIDKGLFAEWATVRTQVCVPEEVLLGREGRRK